MNEIKLENNCLESLLLSDEALDLDMCEIVVDLSQLCRTCLRETTDNDLTNETLCIINASGTLVRLYEMFEVATGLKIESDDKLPHHMCSTCLKLVNNLYTFRTQSQRADEILRNILNKMKREADDPLEENKLDDEFREEEEEIQIIDSSKDLDVMEEFSVAEESTDDFYDTQEDDVMEIEELEEVSEPEEKYEARSMDVSTNFFTCLFCTRVYFLQRDVVQHYKDEHPTEKPFKCEVCSAAFTHIQSLRRHSKTHIASAKEKMCAICSRMFHRADDLKRHIRTHTDERPYHCSMCEKAFKQHTELKDHLLSHTDIKMYKCSLCAKEWRSRNGWYLHMKAHQECGDKHRRRSKKTNEKATNVGLVPDDADEVTNG